jgi:hypothetical protein
MHFGALSLDARGPTGSKILCKEIVKTLSGLKTRRRAHFSPQSTSRGTAPIGVASFVDRSSAPEGKPPYLNDLKRSAQLASETARIITLDTQPCADKIPPKGCCLANARRSSEPRVLALFCRGFRFRGVSPRARACPNIPAYLPEREPNPPKLSRGPLKPRRALLHRCGLRSNVPFEQRRGIACCGSASMPGLCAPLGVPQFQGKSVQEGRR